MAPEKKPCVVRLRCGKGHLSALTADAFVLTRTRSTVIGASFECIGCRAVVDVALPAATIALLAEVGVELSDHPLDDDHEMVAVGDHRRTLSERLLVDAADQHPLRSS